ALEAEKGRAGGAIRRPFSYAAKPLVERRPRLVPQFIPAQEPRSEAAVAPSSACERNEIVRTILATAAFAAGLAATPALAQSNATGGLYVGAIGGYEGLNVDAADGSVTADADSAVYGINAGYDL